MSSSTGTRSPARPAGLRAPSARINADGSITRNPDEPPVYLQYTVSRGENIRPLQFEADLLGAVETGHGPQSSATYRAAIYKTRGGKYVAEFSTAKILYAVDTVHTPVSERKPISVERDGKAEVFDSLDAACDWFRPGPLTTRLLKNLGKWGPEIIE